jgi:hypothetical protein
VPVPCSDQRDRYRCGDLFPRRSQQHLGRQYRPDGLRLICPSVAHILQHRVGRPEVVAGLTRGIGAETGEHFAASRPIDIARPRTIDATSIMRADHVDPHIDVTFAQRPVVGPGSQCAPCNERSVPMTRCASTITGRAGPYPFHSVAVGSRQASSVRGSQLQRSSLRRRYQLQPGIHMPVVSRRSTRSDSRRRAAHTTARSSVGTCRNRAARSTGRRRPSRPARGKRTVEHWFVGVRALRVLGARPRGQYQTHQAAEQ